MELDKPSGPASPFLPMFEGFRAELDGHHDRRERVIKASRDITAASKKIIFSLQRIRQLNKPIPHHISKANAQYYNTISTQYSAIAKDLQGLNAYRYSRNITGGNQEFMEAVTFQHYLATQTLISYEEAHAQLARLGGEDGPVLLSPEDYMLGVFDMVGELMRFAITAIATSGSLPGGESRGGTESEQTDKEEKMELDMELGKQEETAPPPRNVLSDLRELRTYLERLDVAKGTQLGGDVEKKMIVMRTCVEKVENALYGLIIRGKERPKGWVPDLSETGQGRGEVESY